MQKNLQGDVIYPEVSHLEFKRIPDGTYILVTWDDYPIIFRFTLSWFFDIVGMRIPEYINFCLASTDKYDIKYRKHGNNISIYVKQLFCD